VAWVLGKVEEGQAVAVADVEEEVGRAGQIPILEQLGQREAQGLGVELDGALDVGADKRQVIDANPSGPAALGFGCEVAPAQFLAARFIVDLNGHLQPPENGCTILARDCWQPRRWHLS
jgi:hypothetical protein